jgi:hypothetical protein
MLVTWKQYLVLMSFTRRKERVPVRRSPSIQFLLLKLPHLREMLQRPTQLGKLPTIVQAVEEKRIPPSPLGKIEISRKLPLRKKRKNVVQEEEGHRIENHINNFSLEDMELEADIEKMFPTIDHPGNLAHQNSSLEIIENETFNEEESFAFQSIVFDKESKKLIIAKGDMKNKKGKYHS